MLRWHLDRTEIGIGKYTIRTAVPTPRTKNGAPKYASDPGSSSQSEPTTNLEPFLEKGNGDPDDRVHVTPQGRALEGA